MEKKIEDKELGTIILRQGTRYRRYTLKVTGGGILATMPAGGDEKKMLAFIEEKREKLKGFLLEHPKRPLLDETTEMQTATFKLCITRTDRPKASLALQDGVLSLHIPQAVPIEAESVQEKLQEILKNVFRHEAKRTLPGRLAELARTHGFTYTGVKVNSSRTRWGSCSGKKSINLSLYLMKLPWRLIDYVLLHELCHTREMNHSERFWNELDAVTGNRAQSLRKELKQYRIL